MLLQTAETSGAGEMEAWMCKSFHLSKPLVRELLVAARLANVDLVVLRG